MFADLPPNSRLTLLMSFAASCITRVPTSVEPVNETLRTMAWRMIASPTSDPAPVTTLNTPSGIPASNASSAKRSAVSGVCSAGLSTTVLPMASAGADFQDVMAMGKFHGTMIPQTPTGSRSVISTPGAAPGMVCPPILFVAPA